MGKQVKLYTTGIGWSRVMTCYDDSGININMQKVKYVTNLQSHMIIFHTILFLPSDIEMWGKQVNLYITWIIWSRVIACYEDEVCVCVLFQRYQQNNKNYIDSSTDWNLTGPWMHFLFSDLFCFPTHQEDKFQSNDTACFPFAKPKLIEYANFVRIFCFNFPI